MKKGYYGHIEKDSLENSNFRKILYTGEHCQLVLMSLLPKEEIGMEIHEDNDQFFRIEAGMGKVFINDDEYDVKDGDVIIVPAHSEHNVVNTSDSVSLKLYTIYSPAHHKDGIIHTTKAEALADEGEHFEGKTTE